MNVITTARTVATVPPIVVKPRAHAASNRAGAMTNPRILRSTSPIFLIIVGAPYDLSTGTYGLRALVDTGFRRTRGVFPDSGSGQPVDEEPRGECDEHRAERDA